MLTVHVQVLGLHESAYDWITIGAIENPKSVDFDFLRKCAMDVINCRNYRHINAARMKIINDRDQMKVTFMDLW